MNSISTHVLDTSRGRPAAGINVTLVRLGENRKVAVEYRGITDKDGRISNLLDEDTLVAGIYRITFDTADYAGGNESQCFYPQVDVCFRVDNPDEHYHVPLLLSPYGYGTYRGS